MGPNWPENAQMDISTCQRPRGACQKFFFTSSQWPLACVLLLLAVFWCHLVNFPSEKSILPYFSSPRGVAISVSFPEARIRKETVSGLQKLSFVRLTDENQQVPLHLSTSPLFSLLWVLAFPIFFSIAQQKRSRGINLHLHPSQQLYGGKKISRNLLWISKNFSIDFFRFC